ncbi:UDP-Glycosyltransferase/glycogen phosphorylase [Rhizophagus irregularis]|uniref:UDP-Glycosyltransferase/glycogen phosphorylase n=1 Tax=Rhizophagus irregularis TaxID=588596 RepID=A0A2N0RYH2_9GLOM|nr:UDP-Glycosyltransferase/glycogen phosphorylase [Rhizophagus irregularis]
MIKRKSILLLLVPFLLNLVFCVNFITAVQNDISKGVDIDRSNIPKNILFGSFMGGRSHVKPMLDIATILAERGYNVILLASGNNVLSSEYPAVKQISLGPGMGMKNLGKDGIDEEQDYNAMKSLWEMGVISYKRTYEKYKSVVEDYNIDLIFCDLLINEACIDVANTLKKPVVVLVSALQIVDPKPYKFDPILGCNISLENESIWERFRCNFIQVFRYVYSLSDFTNQLNEMRKQMNVDLGQLTLGGFKASLVLIDTFFGFELPQTLPPYVQEIGPILSEEYPPLTPELSDFINGHERVLYVSFGTLYSTTTDNNSKLLQLFIEAINKKIIDGVVWALVETPKDYFYPTLKLSDGTQIQTSQILNNEHPHIHIAEFVPQFAILNHTNTKLFFNHGGAGSAHESLYTGTPMLVLPFAGDQMGNAQKLVSAGVASSLKLTTLDVNDILNKMDSLLKEENVKNSSERLKVLAKINSKRKYRAADLIEYILHSSSFVEYVDDDFLKEWVPAETRMGFIKAYNLDIYAILIGIALSIIGIIVVKLIKFIGFIISPSSDDQKSKKD